MNIYREYRKGDIDCVKSKETGQFCDEDIETYTNYTMTIDDGEVRAVMGIVKLWNGVGQGFVITDEGYIGGISYVRLTIKTMLKGMRQLGLWRLQTYINEEWNESMRFATIIGLNRECKLKRMSPTGDDLFLYARVEG